MHTQLPEEMLPFMTLGEMRIGKWRKYLRDEHVDTSITEPQKTYSFVNLLPFLHASKA